MDGYVTNHSKKVITVFSAPNYCFRCGNKAAIMEVDETLKLNYLQYEQNPEKIDTLVSRRAPNYFL